MMRITIINEATGELVQHVGSFETAAAACSNCAAQLGHVLIWERTPECWEARNAGLIYQVLAESESTEQ